MKKIFLHAVLVACLAAAACSNKNADKASHEHGNADATEWKEMDDFHIIMAEAFHPYKDSANLAPAKENAPELAASAAKWAAAELPEKVNNDTVKEKLNQLSTQASSFASVVQAGDDEVIAESLTQLHDLFHEIQEAWYGGQGGEHHH
jgi:outer membrane murein-binding lipoprotein Lpp